MKTSFALGALLGLVLAVPATGAPPSPRPTTALYPRLYKVEWVYKIRYGFKEEWWKLFQKYQIPILERGKQRGFLLDYEIHKPDLHTSEDSRWDYRIIVTYPDRDGPYHEGEVTRELYPDPSIMAKDEQRRWEITEQHWDLPIHDVDPKGSGF
jgi:hypothetical protein